MKEEYVSFEQAVKLKGLGFDWRTYAYYSEKDRMYRQSVSLDHNTNDGGKKELCSAPTLALAQKWLREVKKISVEARVDNSPNAYFNDMEAIYFPTIIILSGCKINGKYWNENLYNSEPKWFDAYELALSAGIDTALELLTDKPTEV